MKLGKFPSLPHSPATCCTNATEQFHFVAIRNRRPAVQPLQPVQNTACCGGKSPGAKSEMGRYCFDFRSGSTSSASDFARGEI
jgi:hypothetical protein